MKDRTPKFPGRVKLKPVAGQTDTYDMTRADDPDDTGTPFNKRTMLQDSTAQLLKLPLANPFVDDALRHMVDRIVPIGTIRTSPAQSLGDAWLKCDGSMVTFENYPQLCSVLRNTGGAVTWSKNNFPSTYTGILSVSDPVHFDGKWLVAIRSVDSWVKILSTSSLDGTWMEEASYPTNNYDGVALCSSENYCICAFLSYYSGSKGCKLTVKVKEIGNQAWSDIETGVGYQTGTGTVELLDIDHCGDRFAVLFTTSLGTELAYSDTPNVANSWNKLTSTTTAAMEKNPLSLSCINEQWFMVSGESVYFAGDRSMRITVWRADNINFSNFTAAGIASYKLNADSTLRIASKVALYAGVYYFMTYSSYAPTASDNITPYVWKTTNFTNWSSDVLNKTVTYGGVGRHYYAVASDTMLLLAAASEAWTTSASDVGYSNVSFSGMLARGAAVEGMVAVVSATTGIAYHDYTYDSRLLPKISMSDDTTTFIKAKNELDVFEAQAGGD